MYTLIKTTSLTLAEFSQAEGDFSVIYRSQVQSLCPSGMSPQRLKDALVDGEYVLLTSLPNLPLIEKRDNWVISYLCQAELSHTGRSRIQQQLDSQQRTTSGKGAARKLVRARYAPVVDIEKTYQPEPVRTDEPDPKFWNYCFEVLGSEASFRHYFKYYSFRLMKTHSEAPCSSWQKTPTEYGICYTTKARVNESKQLRFTCTNLPVAPRLPHRVQLSEQGEEEVNDAFIPVVPTVQSEQRLGFPVKGYFYHFHNKELMQEYKVVDDGMHFFYITLSDNTILNDDRAFNVDQSAIMVFWKINGQTAENQHLVYLDRQITRNELNNLSDEWLSEHGVLLDLDALLQAVRQTPAERPESPEANDSLPAKTPQTYHQALDTYYSYPKDTLDIAPLRAITKAFVKQDVPVVRITCLPPPKVLRIGVFFDGTGQNSPNDQYKEHYGNKARSNIARLYEGYPESTGESARIYISGVGTVDDIEIAPGERNPVIDSGDDEKGTGQAFGMFDDTGALWKWQQLLKKLRDVVYRLGEDYSNIQHIEFDVFGFSRGAALARHFVNAVQQGLPDYLNPDKGPSSSTLFPNLMGNERYPRFDARSDEFYPQDKHRRATVRFVGLFDTVGSFYRAGNEKDGEFCLGLKEDAAERVYQICAAHEYRSNFPLTCLGSGAHKGTAFINGIFYQEVFPGSHSDIGGGYPSKIQYGRTDLPERLNIPVDQTYNRHCVKTDNFLTKYHAEINSLKEANAAAALAENKLAEENQAWLSQSQQTAGVHGEVKLVDGQLHYYHLLPVSNALTGLTLERMKQQSALCGVEWNEDLIVAPQDYSGDSYTQEAWKKLSSESCGEIQAQWKPYEEQLLASYIHRPHDALINPGYSSVRERLINGVHRDKDNNLVREVYSND